MFLKSLLLIVILIAGGLGCTARAQTSADEFLQKDQIVFDRCRQVRASRNTWSDLQSPSKCGNFLVPEYLNPSHMRMKPGIPYLNSYPRAFISPAASAHAGFWIYSSRLDGCGNFPHSADIKKIIENPSGQFAPAMLYPKEIVSVPQAVGRAVRN